MSSLVPISGVQSAPKTLSEQIQVFAPPLGGPNTLSISALFNRPLGAPKTLSEQLQAFLASSKLARDAPKTLSEQMKAFAAPSSLKQALDAQKTLSEHLKAFSHPSSIKQALDAQKTLSDQVRAIRPERLNDAVPPVSRDKGIVVSAIRTAGEIGQLVRAERRRRKLSQQAFADLAGVGRRFLSELENGKPSLEFDKVLSVAAAAGIDLIARVR